MNKKKRALEQNGYEYEIFKNLHTEPNCSVQTVFLRTGHSGFYHVGISQVEDYEVPGYYYHLECTAHNSHSREFMDMIWLEGAVQK